MSDGVLATLQDAIVAEIKETIPGLRTVSRHHGRFDEKEAARISAAAPAVYVVFLGTPDGEVSGGRQGLVQASFAAFVVTTGASRDKGAQNIAEAVAKLATSSSFGHAEGGADKVEIQNLYTSGVGDKGLAMYAVSWTCLVVIGESIFGPDEEEWDPTQLFLGGLGGEGELLPLDPDNTDLLEPVDEP